MPEAQAVLAELLAREPLFHRTELGTSRGWFEASTSEDFWEVGASGAAYDRETVWRVLAQRYASGEPDRWEVSQAVVRPLTTDTFLLTYLLDQSGRTSRRVSVWQRTGHDWQVVYHQGTPVID